MSESPGKPARQKIIFCFILSVLNCMLVSDVLPHSIISKKCLWHGMTWPLGHSITTKYEQIKFIYV